MIEKEIKTIDDQITFMSNAVSNANIADLHNNFNKSGVKMVSKMLKSRNLPLDSIGATHDDFTSTNDDLQENISLGGEFISKVNTETTTSMDNADMLAEESEAGSQSESPFLASFKEKLVGSSLPSVPPRAAYVTSPQVTYVTSPHAKMDSIPRTRSTNSVPRQQNTLHKDGAVKRQLQPSALTLSNKNDSNDDGEETTEAIQMRLDRLVMRSDKHN